VLWVSKKGCLRWDARFRHDRSNGTIAVAARLKKSSLHPPSKNRISADSFSVVVEVADV